MATDTDAARTRIAEQSHRQATDLEQVATMARDVRQVGSQIREANQHAELATQRAREMVAGQQAVVGELGGSLRELRKIGRDMGATRHLIGQVRQRVGLIQRVAEECRMLSLNASIEAVRAGESGASFQVVAQSMRELASSSGAYATEIDALVEQVVARIRELSSETEQAVLSGSERIERVEQMMHQVAGGLDQSAEAVQEASLQADAQETVAAKLAKHMQDVAEANSHETAVILGILDGVEIRELLPASACDKLDEYVIIDVRSHEEWADDIGRIRGAKLMPIKSNLNAKLARLDRDKRYLFVCRSGGRSMRACRLALALGFRDLTNLAGGMLAWQEAGLPMDTAPLAT